MNGWPLLLRQVVLPGAGWSAFTAVPMAMNSATSLPNSRASTVSRTPTIPSAPRAAASASIRVIASSRAWYIAWLRVSSSWFLFHRPICMPTW